MKPCICRSQRRTGWCESPARLLFRLPRSCSAVRRRSRIAERSDLSLWVTIVDCAKPCFFSRLRISFSAAAFFRLDRTRVSRTSPSLSTAGHRYIRFPRTEMNISSRCHRQSGLGRRRRILRADAGPNFNTQRRFNSHDTSRPHSASRSSISR